MGVFVRATAATVKGNHKNGRLREYPEECTQTRALFDAFMASPGLPIEIAPVCDFLRISRSNFSGTIARLRDSYELDVRCLARGVWVLAGRWNGSEYTDYIAPIVKGLR